jgi:hypothetical protein
MVMFACDIMREWMEKEEKEKQLREEAVELKRKLMYNNREMIRIKEDLRLIRLEMGEK